MTCLRTAVVALLALNAVQAFAPLAPVASSSTALRMADKKDDPTLMKSVLKKQIAYDENTGRFFETNINEEDCIPDEEFCMTDNDSGDLIRLTVEEKERIFMDALQVGTNIRPRIVTCVGGCVDTGHCLTNSQLEYSIVNCRRIIARVVKFLVTRSLTCSRRILPGVAHHWLS